MFLSVGVSEICPEVSPEISGGPEILALGPEVPVQEFLAKLFSCFLCGGVPELCPGSFSRKFPGTGSSVP